MGVAVLALGGLSPTTGHAQSKDVEDPWAPYRTLVGSWEGDIAGELGTGSAIRTYEFILDGQYLLSRHASVRLPQPESPQGDHHREMGVYSYDGARELVVFRKFIVEGFVLQYWCEAESAERRIVCVTESVENGEGMRARETINLKNDYEFEEIFELAPDGGDLSVLFTNRWRRSPRLE
jgi:hypothetical protein